MQSPTRSDIHSGSKSYLNIVFYTVFLVFTIVLITMTWNIQNSCEPLVGNSPCGSAHSSVITKTWNFTKDKSTQILQKSLKLIPNKVLFWK